MFSSINRFFKYGTFGYSIQEHSYTYLYRLIKFFLSRMIADLENKPVVQKEITLKSIRICIKLLDRLIKNNYNFWRRKHSKKWSQITKNIDLEKEKDFLFSIEMDNKQKQKDLLILYAVLSKYHEYWKPIT